jgi:hypothetical protein
MGPKVLLAGSMVIAMYVPTCTPAIRPTALPEQVRMHELWQEPDDLQARDLYFGPWGAEHAPDAQDTYTFVRLKDHGVNPGVVVTDSRGREWHVKQAGDNDRGAEGPVEVVLSRVLSAVGYHQPPVYFIPPFTMTDASGTHSTPGGRFRLHGKFMKSRDEWSWQQNPFVGTRPYQGLLVILLMFNSSDLKNSNNTLYDVTWRGETERWYVVRDLGTALGETGRLDPKRSDPDLFGRLPFIRKVEHGFVKLHYLGWHQELVEHRLTVGDVRWASELLSGLSERQWQDAFRAGGYEPATATRFIRRLHEKIEEGLRLPRPEPQPTAFDLRPARPAVAVR